MKDVSNREFYIRLMSRYKIRVKNEILTIEKPIPVEYFLWVKMWLILEGYTIKDIRVNM